LLRTFTWIPPLPSLAWRNKILIAAGTPKILFEKAASDYDVHPDGRRFLLLKPAAATDGAGELHIILNWFDDLRKKVPLEE
jgi:hypothetical protein